MQDTSSHVEAIKKLIDNPQREGVIETALSLAPWFDASFLSGVMFHQWYSSASTTPEQRDQLKSAYEGPLCAFRLLMLPVIGEYLQQAKDRVVNQEDFVDFFKAGWNKAVKGGFTVDAAIVEAHQMLADTGLLDKEKAQ